LSVIGGAEEGEGEEEEAAANVAKNPATPAVTAGNKEKRKPFFRRVSIQCKEVIIKY